MRLMPANIKYFGIDIAIQNPAPNLMESDLVESEIAFDGMRFNLVTALGVFGVSARSSPRNLPRFPGS